MSDTARPKYIYKTEPLPHQRELLRRTWGLKAYGVFWEPGCGKSKPMIDNFCWLYESGRHADMLLVVAPNGVHRNWVSDEVPAHMPDRVRDRLRTLIWSSQKSTTQKYRRLMDDLIQHDGPIMLVVNYESTIVKRFKQFIARLHKKRKMFMVLDEAHRIKGNKTHVKLTLTALGQHAAYRRALTGTPLEKPEDVYAQVRFIDREFWARQGFRTPVEFRHRYQIYKKRSIVRPDRRPGRSGNRTIEFDQPVGVQNLAELAEYMKKITHRLTKESAGLNLPPKLYSRRYCTMTSEQRRVYTELKRKTIDEMLKKENRVTLQSGNALTVTQSMTKMLRLQQIACGYVACEAEQPVEMIEEGVNNRLDMAVEEILTPLPHQAIVWARFTPDIDQLMRALGERAVRYDGEVSEADRAINKLAFQQGDVQFFVGKIKAGGTGLTLVGAKTMLYYSNMFDMIPRVQSEDRFHRVGQTVPVNVIDLIAEDTIDEYIVESMQKKFDVAAEVNQDAFRAWICSSERMAA
jgi:SNF2 family DNA or RNA helicase